MPTTVIDLCNMALGRVGAGRISALTENTNEAIWCNLYFSVTRDEVLRSRKWKCATTIQSLARESTSPIYGWSYSFQLPINPRCLRIIGVNPDSGFERVGDKIYSNETELDLKYVKQVEDPNEFDDLLGQAIVARLASKLATAVANNPELSNALFREYLGVLQLAKQADGADASGDDLNAELEAASSTDLIANR